LVDEYVGSVPSVNSTAGDCRKNMGNTKIGVKIKDSGSYVHFDYGSG
jgi:hypothetical protein